MVCPHHAKGNFWFPPMLCFTFTRCYPVVYLARERPRFTGPIPSPLIVPNSIVHATPQVVPRCDPPFFVAGGVCTLKILVALLLRTVLGTGPYLFGERLVQ